MTRSRVTLGDPATYEARDWRHYVAAFVSSAAWLYLAAVVSIWLLLRIAGDRWWFATVLLFGPRWLYAVPLVVLLPAAAMWRRRTLGVVAASAVVAVAGIMNLCLPWARLYGSTDNRLRIMTYNVHGNSVQPGELASLTTRAACDIVVVEESSSPTSWRWPSGWHVRHAGQLVVASRWPIRRQEEYRRKAPPSPWPPVNALYCLVECPGGPIGVCALHLRSPRSGLSEVLDRNTGVSIARSSSLSEDIQLRALECADLSAWLERKPGPLILAGDFNMPVESRIYGQYLSGYTNAFSSAGLGFGYTKWTRVGPLAYGLRIDHILLSPELRATRSWLGPDLGSDHLPLLADIQGDCPDFRAAKMGLSPSAQTRPSE